jgi:hypothetical protein
VTGVEVLTDVPQPVTSSEATVSEIRPAEALLRRCGRIEEDKEDIGHIAFCVLRNFFGTSAELAAGHSPMDGDRLPMGALVNGVIA